MGVAAARRSFYLVNDNTLSALQSTGMLLPGGSDGGGGSSDDAGGLETHLESVRITLRTLGCEIPTSTAAMAGSVEAQRVLEKQNRERAREAEEGGFEAKAAAMPGSPMELQATIKTMRSALKAKRSALDLAAKRLERSHVRVRREKEREKERKREREREREYISVPPSQCLVVVL